MEILISVGIMSLPCGNHFSRLVVNDNEGNQTESLIQSLVIIRQFKSSLG